MAPALSQQPHPERQCSDGGGDTCMKKTGTISGAPALDGPAALSDDVCCHREGNPDKLPALRRTGSIRLQAAMLQMLRPTCRQLSMPALPSKPGSLGRKRVVGTLYGHRSGRAVFAVQDDPSSEEPLILLELAVATGQLVKEMASGTVRILLECERQPIDAKKTSKKKKEEQNPQGQANQSPPAAPALWEEPTWTMFCNGRRTGCAMPRSCGEADRHVLRAVRTVSAGAGVLPPAALAPPSAPVLEKGKKVVSGCRHGGRGTCRGGGDGTGANVQEAMYMRAKFERVVVSKHSEAFYMMSPSGSKAGTPELSIFLLRL